MSPNGLVHPTPLTASWPARTWSPGEKVTAGMMNGVRDQLNELHSTLAGGGSFAYTDRTNTFTASQKIVLPAAALNFRDTSAAAGSQSFDIVNYGQMLQFRALSDDASVLVANSLFLYRDGSALVGQNLTVNGAYARVGGSAAPAVALRYSAANTMDIVLADGSNWASVKANNYYAIATGNSLGDLTCRGATNFMAGVNITAGNCQIAGNVHNMAGYIYPGQVESAGGYQGSWFLATSSSYGLYTNTGMYLAGAVTCSSSIYAAGGFIAAGGGVTISPVAGAGANNLDCYQEGTWSPRFWSDQGGQGYPDVLAGTYTKIGNLVVAIFRIRLASADWPGGNVLLGDLPFPSENGAVYTVGTFEYWYIQGAATSLILQLPPNANYCYILFKNAASATAHDGLITVANIIAGVEYRGTIIYRTAT